METESSIFYLCAPAASSRRTIPFNALLRPKKPSLSKQGKKAVCGKRHKKRLSIARGRIMGGNSALPGTHPWMAAIYIGELDFCAGTLVSSCWIVSAAHCFFRKYVKNSESFCNPTCCTEYFSPWEPFSIFHKRLQGLCLM